jgi:outer membrane protein TolC
MKKSVRFRGIRHWLIACSCWLLGIGLAVEITRADPPAPALEQLPEGLTRAGAVSWALQYNPELAAFRQQHGIAAAGIVIARTYPFNPILENRVQGNSGPQSATITNRVALEHILLLEVELRGQRTYRRQSASAALTRTDWEIAFQELSLAVRVLRAFDTFIYRQEKLQLIHDNIELNRRSLEQLRALRQAGKTLAQTDLILAETEEYAARAQVGSGQTSLSTAATELRRALGVVGVTLTVAGTLQWSDRPWDAEALIPEALDRRPDLHARQAALAEAEARLQLAIADRYGNPVIGPAYTYDPTRIHLIGGQLNFPIPLFNVHQGEIMQRRAERSQALLNVRQTDVAIRQDVVAALERLRSARTWAAFYRNEIIPQLENALKQMQSLLEQGQGDVLKLIDTRRKFISARDSYLDALLEVSQAQADLAAAVGDPALDIAP